MTVNHSLHFKDPDTGVHTNTIEFNWRSLKQSLSKYGTSNDKFGYMSFWVWRHNSFRICSFYQFLSIVHKHCTLKHALYAFSLPNNTPPSPIFAESPTRDKSKNN